MNNRHDKIVKTKAGWHKADQVKKIRIIMTMVAVALSLSICAGAVLAWVEIKNPFDRLSSSKSTSSVSAAAEDEPLPVYDDSYSLVLVNSSHSVKSDFTVQKESFEGVTVDQRIVPALREMMQAAKGAGCPLALSAGYVEPKEQEKLFQAEVESLKKNQGYSQVRAENQAQSTVGRAGYSEKQTGMAVQITAQGLEKGADFTATAQYRWLVQNSVDYGFVQRYPQSKVGVTGMAFSPGYFRYVGTNHAVKMRALGMCLEEYAGYIYKQKANG